MTDGLCVCAVGVECGRPLGATKSCLCRVSASSGLGMSGAVLHWDWENAPVPRGVSVMYALGEMRKAVHLRFGPVLGAYVYADPQTLTTARRLELSACGLDVIDCGRDAGKANVVDFRIISRSMVELARPVAVGQTRCAVVVVTGDGDYSYCVSVLRNVDVPTMIIFDGDRRESVAASMLQVADHTLPISFKGDDCDDLCDDPDGESLGGDDAPAGVASLPSDELTTMQRTFILALQRAPPANDENYRTGTAVGSLFHSLRGAVEPTKATRNAVYQATLKQLLACGRVERRENGVGNALLLLKT